MIVSKMVVGALVGVLSLSQTPNPGDTPRERAHKLCYTQAEQGLARCSYTVGDTPFYEFCRDQVRDALHYCMIDAGPVQSDVTHE